VIFLTVGTQFPFDRLVRAVDDALGREVIAEEVFAQTGEGAYRPRNMRFAPTLPRDVFAEYVRAASAMVGHAGMGTILTALEAGKPLLVMPRLRRYGEIVNDHQVATAKRFAALGHVLLAADEYEIPKGLAALGGFRPTPRKPNNGPLLERLRTFVEGLTAP